MVQINLSGKGILEGCQETPSFLAERETGTGSMRLTVHLPRMLGLTL
jgi:hypothetical protein